MSEEETSSSSIYSSSTSSSSTHSSSTHSSAPSINLEQSRENVSYQVEESKENEEENQNRIEELKRILEKPNYSVFNSGCLRKKTNSTVLTKLYKFDHPSFERRELLQNISEFSPKLEKLLNVIADLDNADIKSHGRLFKHFIFSDLKGMQGAKLVTSALIAKGMNLGYDAELIDETPIKYGKIKLTPNETLLKSRGNNLYLLSSVAVFDQPISVSKKKEILANFNSRPDNVYGDLSRIIVMDSGFKEGIDLFDIKYIHIFEPQSTMADQKQVIGRGTRTCGQKGLVFHPTMGWPLFVFNYDIEINEEYRNRFNGSKSAFDLYLKSLKIDLRLFNFLSELEDTYIYGSVDYELNKNIHNFAVVRPTSVGEVNGNSGTSYSSVRSFSGGAGTEKLIPFPNEPTGFEETRDFVTRHFGQFGWDGVKMENQCGYAGPPLGKNKKALPPNPLRKTPEEDDGIVLYTPSSKSISQLTDNSLSYETSSPLNEILIPPTPDFFFPDRKNMPPLYKLPLNDKVPLKLAGGCGSIVQGISNTIFGGGPTSIVNLSPSQAFVREYFTPENPQKGILLNWSVGTGKTCAAIATATTSFESAGYTILWVTRTTLKNDIWKNMFEQVCSNKINQIINNAGGIGAIPPDQASRMKLLSKAWSIRPMSYKQFSNLVSKENSFYKSLVKKNGIVDPLRKTLLIIDEAHKLYGGNDLSSLERPDMRALHKALMDSHRISGADSVRVLLMTATPITVDPMELIKLLNLCKTPEQQLPENFSEFANRFSLTDEGKFSPQGKDQFLDEIAGYISYLNREKDARQFSQPVLKQIKVPLVSENGESKDLIDKFDLPFYDAESEENKEFNKLESEFADKENELLDWSTVTAKAKFKPLLDKCNGFSKETKKKCISTVKEHINSIVEEAKEESKFLRSQMKEIKEKMKTLKVFQKEKVKEVRENIEAHKEEYLKFKNSLYNNLKNVCSVKVNSNADFKNVVEELPEIAEINRLIDDTDKSIKQLQIDFKSKIQSFKTQIMSLKQQLRENASGNEKEELKKQIASEEKRFVVELKNETRNVKRITNELKGSKKSYEKTKKRMILNTKKIFKKDLKSKTSDLKKTRKMKLKLENIDVEKRTENLKKLISEKKAIIQNEIANFEADEKILDENKEIERQAKEAEKQAAKRAKEAEKEAAKQAKEAEKEAAKRAKEAEKEAAKRAKEAEKEAAKRAKEAEKALKQTKKIQNNPKNKTAKK